MTSTIAAAASVYVDLSGNAHGFVASRQGALQDLWTPDRQIVRVNPIANDGRLTGMLNTFTLSFQVHAFRARADGAIQDLGDSMYASVGWAIEDLGTLGGRVAGAEAFRLGSGAGRTYTIAVRCADMSDNGATSELVVRVPHDRR